MGRRGRLGAGAGEFERAAGEEHSVQVVWMTAALPAEVTEPALVVAGAVLLVMLVVQGWLVVRVRRLGQSYKRLMAGSSGEGLERTLFEHLDRVAAATARADEVADTCRALEERLTGCIQRVGILRFDAFEDVGGQFSFALALLDGHQNGVVLSSLHGRQETRFYVKPITEGRSEVPLTEEECAALRQAGCEVEGPRLQRLNGGLTTAG
ncbi:MAG: DUF4446 family protein [Armatimonadetes bacterium]|jgi:hypothetical protein|nr:DUF4446 family protein [Armatimonadota bacterium]